MQTSRVPPSEQSCVLFEEAAQQAGKMRHMEQSARLGSSSFGNVPGLLWMVLQPVQVLLKVREISASAP